MDQLESNTIILYLSLSLLFLLLSFKLTRRRRNLPSGPPSLPIIGNLHLLKPPLYRLYHRLSHQYGPIFSLRFGSRLLVVVSSATLAQECFTANDVVLANRPKSIAGKHMGYNSTTFSFASYGDHWRNLRRIGAVEIFSSARLNAFLAIRSDEVRRLLLRLSEGSETQLAMVELKPILVDLTFNNIMRMMAGKRYGGNDDVARKLKELISEAFRGRGLPNPRDFIPILNLFGEGSSEKMVKNLAKNLDELMQKLVDEHRQGERKNTMIDHLLSLQQTEPDYYTDQIIKGLVLAFMLAGTDTSAVTLEWAMANLLNYPQAMQKLRAELDEQIGQERVLEEQDLSKLPYLENVIWETLRLYPATPLLLPHMASADCRIGGYDVPRGTMVVVNAWAIHRDPEVWEDAESFKPERFETEQRESHKLLPFGSGRRACPGSGLALRVMALALGSMVQCFDWERVGEDEIDMSEALGTTMPKAQPLVALCRARPVPCSPSKYRSFIQDDKHRTALFASYYNVLMSSLMICSLYLAWVWIHKSLHLNSRF